MFPFDETTTNIEDRLWGSEVIKMVITFFTHRTLACITIMGLIKAEKMIELKKL